MSLYKQFTLLHRLESINSKWYNNFKNYATWWLGESELFKEDHNLKMKKTQDLMIAH